MRITAFLIAAVLSVPAYAQNLANIMVNPEFQALDNNGLPVASGKLCTYIAGTNTPATTWADSGQVSPNSNPVVMDSSGRAKVYGTGNYKFVLEQPGDGNCPGTGAVIWTVDSYFVVNQSPTFASVVATTFNSTATGSTAAYQQQFGTFVITGGGDAAFQTVTATTTFNSLASGTTNAFQQQFGTFTIKGNGAAAFQSVAANVDSLVGFSSDCTAPGAGFAFICYNTTTGSLRYNLGGAGWNSFPIIPGSNGQIIFNNSGTLGANAGFTIATGTCCDVTITGSAVHGYIGPVFNSTNTGGNNAFQTNTGTMYITGAGNAGFQTVAANAFITNSGANTDTAGIVTLSGGTFTLNWPSGHTYSTNPICTGTDYTAVAAVSLGPTTTHLVFNGTGSHQVMYVCVGGLY